VTNLLSFDGRILNTDTKLGVGKSMSGLVHSGEENVLLQTLGILLLTVSLHIESVFPFTQGENRDQPTPLPVPALLGFGSCTNP
jgi:hypothetical protein